QVALQASLRLQPDRAETRNNLGFILARQGRLEEAAASIHEALRLRPGYAEAHNNLGLVLAAQGKPNEAAFCFQKALELRPEYADARNNLANLFQKPEPPANVESADLQTQEEARAHNLQGIAAAQEGRLEEAASSFQQALRLRPDYAQAHNNLGNVLM